MYSIVMVAAMTASPEAPDFFFKNKGGGCYGCYGGGCYGSGWGGGCYGGGMGYGGCNGCWGGGGMKGFKFGGGGMAFVGSGCCGGYAAPYYTGCSGYYAPGGAYVAPGAGAYYPGYGPGYGPPGYGPAVGVTGGVNVDGTGTTGTTSGGTSGRTGTGAGTTGTGTGTGTGGTGTGTGGTGTGTGGTGGGKGGGGAGGAGGAGGPGGGPGAFNVPQAVPYLPAGRAQVVVLLPADAKLYADGVATQIGGPERVFLTPEISTARDYQYALKVETPAGEPQTKQVVVRAGHRTVVEFAAPVAAAEKASSPVTVTLPEKAKLFVDGVAAAAAGGTHTFRTPELTRGKPYVYEFRAEVEKDGKTEVVSRQVTFKAGEPVAVNFVEADGTRTASAK